MTGIMNGKSGRGNKMTDGDSEGRMSGGHDKPLEERLSIISATLHETMRDLAAASRDLLCTEEGHALMRKSVEEAGKKLEAIILEATPHRDDGKERISEESGDFKRREIRIN